MNIRTLLIPFALIHLVSVSQNVTINGVADRSFARKLITLSIATDYVTGIAEQQDTATIAEDGTFSLSMQTSFTRPATLSIGKVWGTLFVRPDYVYGIRFPAPENVDPRAAGQQVNITVIGRDSTELNALIIDYQDVYNKLMTSSEDRYLSRPMLFRRADSLRKICASRYAEIKDAFFSNYVEYSVASLNAAVSRAHNYLLSAYIVNKPVLVDHSAYMDFFLTCFRGYFNAVASRYPGRSLYNIVNEQASLQQLDDLVKQDATLSNDTLRELVIIANLWESCFDPQFRQEQVMKIVAAINHGSAIEAHRSITSHMLAWFGKLLPGSAAPDFSAIRPDGSSVSFSSLKGRWVYLNFFMTTNIEALREIPKIAALKKLYGDKVTFVSVCVDDSIASFRKFLRTTPGLTWNVWFDGAGDKRAREKYGIAGGEGYFLVGTNGYLVQSPALSPSKGIEYRFNQLFRVKPRTRKTGIR